MPGAVSLQGRRGRSARSGWWLVAGGWLVAGLQGRRVRSIRRCAGNGGRRRRGRRVAGPPPAVFHDLAVGDADYPVRVRSDLGVVRHQQKRDPLLDVEPAEQFQDLLTGPRVEVSGGLVGQEQDRLVDQRTGDRHPLLLAAGELVRRMVRPCPQSHHSQQFLAPLGQRPPPPTPRRVGRGHPHVDLCRHARKKVETLENETNMTAAELRQLVPGKPRDLNLLEAIGARRGLVHAPQQVHQRRLA